MAKLTKYVLLHLVLDTVVQTLCGEYVKTLMNAQVHGLAAVLMHHTAKPWVEQGYYSAVNNTGTLISFFKTFNSTGYRCRGNTLHQIVYEAVYFYNETIYSITIDTSSSAVSGASNDYEGYGAY